MINWQLFTAFLLITFVLVITPGPIVTLVIATGATRGIRAALTTVIGTTVGNAVLLAAIALGLSWVLKASAELFEVMRWCGVVYLIYLGVQTWRTAAVPPDERGEGLDLRRVEPTQLAVLHEVRAVAVVAL